jgi:beta-lactamase superfamily II metal-dependent hydrolase
MPVTMMFDSGQAYDGRAHRDCIASAKAHNVRIVIARQGMHWSSGDGLMLDVLAPSMLHAGRFRELFMGDAGEASEGRLLASGIDLHADAVKVGHHGSRYASTPAFVAAVHPRIAVISVGRHNTFGHPAPATIEAWHGAGTGVLRTDPCGAISLVDGSPTTTLRCAVP